MRGIRCHKCSILLIILCTVIVELTGGHGWWEQLVQDRIRLNVCPDQKYELCGAGHHKNTMCQCDGDCATYGDCCADVAPIQQAGSLDWRCIFHVRREFYALARCPESYVEDDVSRACSGSGSEMRHLQQLPVFSQDTRIMYANIFCAVCHEDVSSLMPWTVGLHCTKNSSGYAEVIQLLKHHKFRYSESARSFMRVRGDGQRVFCQLRIEDVEKNSFFNDLYGVRECRLHYGTCPDGADPEDVRKCSMYTAMVYSPRKLANYRNIHCAKCRNDSVQSLECGAHRATYGLDASNIFTPIHQLTTTFLDAEKCHTFTSIYDPLFDECFNGHETSQLGRMSPNCSAIMAASPLFFLPMVVIVVMRRTW